MSFRRMVSLACWFSIFACGAVVLVIVRIEAPEALASPRPLLVALAVLMGFFSVAAAYVVSWSLGAQMKRIAGVLKEKARGEPGEPSSVNLPIAFNELGYLSATLNVFNRNYIEEVKRNEAAKQQLTGADEEKSLFLATISHELRTPLNTILGFSQVLIDGTEGELSDSQLENIKIIEHSGHNLLGLINDILDLSELESGRLQIHRQKVNIHPLIQETVKEVSGQIRGKRTTILTQLEGTALEVYADPKRTYQILMNLLNNAVKFTPKGEILVRTQSREGAAVVEVKDAGYGIAPQDLPFIFLEFRQAGSLRSRRKGAGLGLAICKRLVEVQGGAISCESTPSKGSTFTFTLPLYSGQPEAKDEKSD
jgi:signal transduction histidine kinase